MTITIDLHPADAVKMFRLAQGYKKLLAGKGMKIPTDDEIFRGLASAMVVKELERTADPRFEPWKEFQKHNLN